MSASSSTRILIVEDEAVVALDIERRVTGLGHTVVATTDTAEEAIELAERERPDLILMDIRLRGLMDGIEAGRQIRNEWRIPVVYLTAHADEPTLARAKETAPFGYILKPFDEQKLRVTLEVALAKHAREEIDERHRRDLLAVLDALPTGTVLVDRQGCLSFANSVSRRMLQLKDSSLGEPWQRGLKLSAETARQIDAEAVKPPASRSRVPIQSSKSEHAVLEAEVVDDPRAEGGRILFLHDVTEIHALRAQLVEGAEFENMIGRSESMQRVFQIVADLAPVDSSVLIRGETGTGKELVARALHRRSARSRGPFIVVNCGGLSDELATSQLFGHARGSFTGAVTDRQGYFEAADGGVLFLDEIGELSERVQATLLRVLEDNEIVRIGENHPRPVDVRLVAATHRDLEREIAEGRFRADLYYRIRVAQIDLPPLRERREDIPLLTEALLAMARAATGKQVTEIDDEALGCLLNYGWPGNVRELRNAIEFGVVRAKGDRLLRDDLPPETYRQNLAFTGAASEKERILAALRQAGGQRKRAAQLLGMSRATFYRRLREYDIDLG
ncbi:MAG: sigma 54-interacting transcriptional regulator [Acidobacteria bacterium]|nr:sigma 54-interacting transcriptional regulator [Acidobacteriota bacterium]